MSAIIRVTDIGRPGLLVYMPQPIADDTFNFLFHAAGPTPERGTNSTSYVQVDSGSFTIPSKTWIYPSTSVTFLFVFTADIRTTQTGVTCYARITIDGEATEINTSGVGWTTFYRAFFKIPSSTTINWRLEIKTNNPAHAVYVRNLMIYCCPVWTQKILYSRDLGANTLLTSVMLPPKAQIRIDNDYFYRNTSSDTVIINFNLLPFNMIEFFGDLIKIEYVRVE